MSINDRPPPLRAHRLENFDYSSPDVGYFVTICTHHREQQPFSDPRLAKEVVAALEWMRDHRAVSLHAYCVMPDHVHLLLRLPGDSVTLGALLSHFKTFTAHRAKKLGVKEKLWQDRFYDHVLRRNEDSSVIARYIVENPVRKGLVETFEAYPWSGMPDPM
jgi:putative transposase